MSRVNSKRLAIAVSATVTALTVCAGTGRPAAAAQPLYVLGPEAAVAKALQGQPVRACAPAVVSLPENFEHLRTPPQETAKAVALRICEVMVVADAEVQAATRALGAMNVDVEVAALGGSSASASGRGSDAGRLILASAGPADQVGATPGEEAEALFYQAFEALQQNRVDASIDLFERGLRLSPTNHLALFYLATAYESAGQGARARPLYERVSSLAPQSQEASQARERLAALRASGVGTSAGGSRFATGIYIDPSSPPEDRSIREVFERSPMAAGENTAPATETAELPPPPSFPAMGTRPPPRIQAPAVPVASPPAPGPEPATSGVAADSPASETAPRAAASRPMLDGGPGARGAGAGRLSTRLGAGRVPAPESVEVATDDVGMSPQPESRRQEEETTTVAGLPWSDETGGTEEARLVGPTSPAEAPEPQQGTVELGRGAIYVGPVQAGRPHGEGRITYPDGSSYEGTLVSGERTGPGVFISSEGWQYEGEFRNGRFDGQGTLMFADGGRYEGEFRQGERTGTGVYTWPGGARYEGTFQDGRITGSGVYVAADGTRYDGDFVEGRRTGEGTLTLPDGRIYVGRVANGLPQGKGNFYWPDGRRFAGEFSRGAADGAGILVYPDGRSESGAWTSDPLMADLVRVGQ